MMRWSHTKLAVFKYNTHNFYLIKIKYLILKYTLNYVNTCRNKYSKY